MLLLAETSPGLWVMKNPMEVGSIGQIEIRRTEAGPRYRVTFKGEVIGWATSLRVASERLWRAHLEDGQQRRGGPPNVRGRSPAE